MNAIVLPIKPIYAGRIYDGIKKYEFRKRLCHRDIKRIYLYETAPVGKVTGYAEVKEKIHDTPLMLWKKTAEYAGIDYADYMEYFKGVHAAGAYALGNIYRFEHGKNLLEFNLSYIPQSYVYIDYTD